MCIRMHARPLWSLIFCLAEEGRGIVLNSTGFLELLSFPQHIKSDKKAIKRWRKNKGPPQTFNTMKIPIDKLITVVLRALHTSPNFIRFSESDDFSAKKSIFDSAAIQMWRDDSQDNFRPIFSDVFFIWQLSAYQPNVDSTENRSTWILSQIVYGFNWYKIYL